MLAALFVFPGLLAFYGISYYFKASQLNLKNQRNESAASKAQTVVSEALSAVDQKPKKLIATLDTRLDKDTFPEVESAPSEEFSLYGDDDVINLEIETTQLSIDEGGCKTGSSSKLDLQKLFKDLDACDRLETLNKLKERTIGQIFFKFYLETTQEFLTCYLRLLWMQMIQFSETFLLS
ncbi:MAG: hypothetical protein ACSNEK_04230 [Parachlamydiaceae bacterium]